MFASKTLDQRNNDPYPWVRGDYRYTDEQRSTFPSQHASYLPRPEYQHGKLEENVILAQFRKEVAACGGETTLAAEAWLRDWHIFLQWEDQRVTLASEQAHAHRVLTLWLAVFA